MKNTVCLVVIFNHQYNSNIEKLRYYYKNRFSHIYFCVPFYMGNDEDVITVYESSYQFQGYFAQGFKKFYDEKYTHYVFIGDDLLLNPVINENNIDEYFCLKPESGYIHSMRKLSDMSAVWDYSAFKNADMSFKSGGAEYAPQLPSVEEAEEKAKKYGFSDFHISFVKLRYFEGNIRHRVKTILSNLFTNMDISYPLVAGYSDIVIVPKRNIYDFCHISGVFAAMNLFVEIAIPTAMMLTCDDIVMSNQLSLRAEEMWKDDFKLIIEELQNKCSCDVKKIKDNFPAGYAYLHPVKLSKWTLY